MFLSIESINRVTERFPANKKIYESIRKWIEADGDLSPIGIKWYICDKTGHICLNCPDFYKIKGNVISKLKHHKQINEDNFCNKVESQENSKKKKKQRNKLNEEVAKKIIRK